MLAFVIEILKYDLFNGNLWEENEEEESGDGVNAVDAVVEEYEEEESGYAVDAVDAVDGGERSEQSPGEGTVET